MHALSAPLALIPPRHIARAVPTRKEEEVCIGSQICNGLLRLCMYLYVCIHPYIFHAYYEDLVARRHVAGDEVFGLLCFRALGVLYQVNDAVVNIFSVAMYQWVSMIAHEEDMRIHTFVPPSLRNIVLLQGNVERALVSVNDV